MVGAKKEHIRGGAGASHGLVNRYSTSGRSDVRWLPNLLRLQEPTLRDLWIMYEKSPSHPSYLSFDIISIHFLWFPIYTLSIFVSASLP